MDYAVTDAHFNNKRMNTLHMDVRLEAELGPLLIFVFSDVGWASYIFCV